MSSLWKETGLNWADVLPEGEDVQAFISQQVSNGGGLSSAPSAVRIRHCSSLELFTHTQKLQFLQTDSSSPDEAQTKKILSPEELSQQLEKLLEDMASDEQIFDWVEVR